MDHEINGASRCKESDERGGWLVSKEGKACDDRELCNTAQTGDPLPGGSGFTGSGVAADKVANCRIVVKKWNKATIL